MRRQSISLRLHSFHIDEAYQIFLIAFRCLRLTFRDLNLHLRLQSIRRKNHFRPGFFVNERRALTEGCIFNEETLYIIIMRLPILMNQRVYPIRIVLLYATDMCIKMRCQVERTQFITTILHQHKYFIVAVKLTEVFPPLVDIETSQNLVEIG